MAKKKFDIGKVTYLDIRDLAFTYAIPDEAGISEKPAKTTQYNLEIIKMFNLEEEIIRLVATIHLQTGFKGAKEIKGLYKTEHLFHIDQLSAWVNRAGDHFEVNEEMNDTLTGLVYSAVRGSIHQKFSGTRFADFILPITSNTLTD